MTEQEFQDEIRRRMEDRRNFDPLRHLPPYQGIEVPCGLLDELRSAWWWKALVVILLAGNVIVAGLAVVIQRGESRRVQARMEKHLPATIDLCAAQLPITHGRLLKTQGEVASWREAKDGGVDLFLVKEIAGGTSCGMKAHLPPTIPETTWRPVSGERVTVCGLVVQGKQRPLMVATWRCL